jgi:hypothetical protein
VSKTKGTIAIAPLVQVKTNVLGLTLAHACHLSYRRQKWKGLLFEASPGKKLTRSPSQPISWAWQCMPVIYTGDIGRRIEV